MSIESWKQEYYTDPSLCTNDRERAEHTKLKYIGTRKENLERHELFQDGHWLEAKNNETIGMSFSGGTCSFCVSSRIVGTLRVDCTRCPIQKENNCCDDSDKEKESAYHSFVNGDPEPMITLMDTILSKCDEDGVYRQ